MIMTHLLVEQRLNKARQRLSGQIDNPCQEGESEKIYNYSI